MPCKIEQQHVELMILQRGNECKHVGALRKISVTYDHHGGAAQPREKPSVSRLAVGKSEGKNRGMAHHYVQIEGGGIPRWTKNLVQEESGNRGDRNEAEQKQRQ